MPGEGFTEAPPAGHAEASGTSIDRPICVLVVDADCDLLRLLQEWLVARGWQVVTDSMCGIGAQSHNQVRHIDIVIVDVPFPRQGGLTVLERIRAEYPAVPVVALSAHFFGGTESNGSLARALGVARVLPKPVTRDTMLNALDQLLAGPRAPHARS